MAFDWFMVRRKPEPEFSFRCTSCGEVHHGSPSFGYDKPYHYFTIPEGERDARITLDDDTCVIDGDLFLIRTILQIPINGVSQPFTWGVWVSQSEASFQHYIGSFNRDQSGNGSFGWLAVTMPGYTVGDDGVVVSLACDVEWGATGQRPSLRLHETDHQLYRDQIAGISWDRAIELARLTMHGT